VIPIAIVAASIGGYASGGNYEAGSETQTIVIGGTGRLFLPPSLMILFREKYPRGGDDPRDRGVVRDPVHRPLPAVLDEVTLTGRPRR
jgi:hypothetical protein